MALVVLAAVFAAIEQELGEVHVGVAASVALDVIDEASKAHEGLFHFLMAVEPVLLARPEVGHPAIRQPLGGVVETPIRALGQGVVIDGRLDEVAGDVALVIAAIAGVPALRPGIAVGQGVGRLQVTV